MDSSRRYLPAVILASLAIVFSATALRLSSSLRYDGDIGAPLPYDRPILKTDESFFDHQDGSARDVPVEASAQSSLPKPASITVPASITASAYLVGNVASGEVYLERNSSTPLPVASMSKLVTAIAATDMMSPTSTVEIVPVGETVSNGRNDLNRGEKFTLEELLYPMLLASSNIAAEAIASTNNRAEFLESMSSYAWEIGMPQAFFADPSGINPHNVSSARGIFALAQYLYKSRPDILSITRINRTNVATTSDHGMYDFESTHPFVDDPRFIGGKTGRTPEAGETMLTIMRIDDQPVALIVLKSAYGTREWDTEMLIKKYTDIISRK